MPSDLQRKILLVDDDPAVMDACALTLMAAGWPTIVKTGTGHAALERLAADKFALAVVDMMLPDMTGRDLLLKMREECPEVSVVMFSGRNDIATVVDCMKAGAVTYLLKPLDPDKFINEVRLVFRHRELLSENLLLKEKLLSGALAHPEAFGGMRTQNAALFGIQRYIEAVAASTQPVLIVGETGSGKELIARAIHHLCGRKGEMVSVNVAELDDTLFSDTLFGHKKGAFTGADSDRRGLIERAENGTLFLDEIGDLSAVSQAKLLRLLQEGEYYRLGDNTPSRTTARVVVATHRNLDEMMKEKKFRADLYYRLRTHRIEVPPLRHRKEDMPLLLEQFMEEAAAVLNKKKLSFPKELLLILAAYPFPGNVRELRAMVFDAVSNHTGDKMLSTKIFVKATGIKNTDGQSSPDAAMESPQIGAGAISFNDPFAFPTLKEARDMLIKEALKRSNNNQNIAARLLGTTRSALNKSINKKSRSPEKKD